MIIKYPSILKDDPKEKNVSACFRITQYHKDLLNKLGGGSPSRGLNIVLYSLQDKIEKHIEKSEKKVKSLKKTSKR